MRFLADMGISPKTVSLLCSEGHDAVHLHVQDLDRLQDGQILEKAKREDRIILTHDLDFGALVAAGKERLPSVVVFRLRDMHPTRVNAYLQRILDEHKPALERGVIISVTEGQVRARSLPLAAP